MKIRENIGDKAALSLLGLLVAALAGVIVVRRPEPTVLTTSASGDVLHIRAELSVSDASRGPEVHELWIVTPTLESRYQISDSEGPVREITARQGVTETVLTTSDSGDQSYRSRSVPSPDSPMLSGSNRILHYKDAIESGDLQILEQGTVQGQPAVRVELEFTTEGTAMKVSAWLGEETLLPLEEITFAIVDGTPHELGTREYVYETVEYLDRTQLPSDFFVLSAPPAVARFHQESYMSLAQAEAFDGFSTYWLGESFGGLPLRSLIFTTSEGGFLELPLEEVFRVAYGKSFAEERAEPVGDVYVLQRPVSQAVTPAGEPAPVAIDNPTLGLLDGALYEGRFLIVQVGDMMIQILARNDQELLEVAENLVPLN